MRRWHALLLVAGMALGCSKGEDNPGGIPKDIADDLKARGLSTEPPPGPGPAPAASEFRPYASPDGLFRVNFPGEPRARQLEAVPAQAKSGMEIYSVDRPKRTYAVTCAHYTEKRNPAEELQNLVDGNVRAAIEGKLLESKDVTLKGRPGKDVTISLDDEMVRRARFFVGETDIYQVVCDLPKNDADGKNGTAFVESFEILKD